MAAACDVWFAKHAVPFTHRAVGGDQDRSRLKRGDVVILDNLAVQKSARAAECLNKVGAGFLFLPAYSPDLNPIETAFSKFKAHLRAANARTLDTLVTVLRDICRLFDPDEC